jgi:hypothetical protein
MALGILDVDDEADAAGVAFVGGVVETLGYGEDHFDFLNKNSAGGSAGAPRLRCIGSRPRS